jgi:hypothetical protein
MANPRKFPYKSNKKGGASLIKYFLWAIIAMTICIFTFVAMHPAPTSVMLKQQQQKQEQQRSLADLPSDHHEPSKQQQQPSALKAVQRAAGEEETAAALPPNSLYALKSSPTLSDGSSFDLSTLVGKVSLVVNVASH